MHRNDAYYLQLVSEAEVDDWFDYAEQAIWNLPLDFALEGITSGLTVAEHAAPANLTIDVTTGTAYDAAGERIRIPTLQVVNCSVDHLGVSTAVVAPGNEKKLAIFAYFDRDLSDPRVDGNSNPLFYLRAESFAFKVVQGAEAAPSAPLPALEANKVLLADVTISFGTTQILNANISTARRQNAFKFNAGALAVAVGEPEAADQAILTYLNTHVTAAGLKHAAGDITAAIAAMWADAAPVVGADVDAVLEEIVVELAAATGAGKIGSDGYIGVSLVYPAAQIQATLAQIADEVASLAGSNVFVGDNEFTQNVNLSGVHATRKLYIEGLGGIGATASAVLELEGQDGQAQGGGSNNNDGGDVVVVPGKRGTGGGGTVANQGIVRTLWRAAGTDEGSINTAHEKLSIAAAGGTQDLTFLIPVPTDKTIYLEGVSVCNNFVAGGIGSSAIKRAEHVWNDGGVLSSGGGTNLFTNTNFGNAPTLVFTPIGTDVKVTVNNGATNANVDWEVFLTWHLMG